MDSAYARDMTAQTQLRFSLNKANNFQRPDPLQGQMSQIRPFPKYQIGDGMNSNPPNNHYPSNFQHPNHLQNRVFVSPVTLTHVSSGHAINIDTRDIQPPSPSDRPDFFSSGDSRGFLGSFSREELFLPPDDYHDQVEQVSIPESGDSGLSRTPDNPSEGPPIQLIDPSFRPRNSTAPQPTIEYMYQQKHFPVQRQRSTNLPPSSRIDFSVKLSIRPTQYSFGFLLGDGAIVEKVDAAPAINEDIQVGDKVSSINGRACDQLTRSELKELLTEAARHRSVTLNLSRITRPAAPELHRTYTDLPLGSIRIQQPGAPPYMSHSSYAPPVRYLSCRHLAPHPDDSSQGRHSWPHCPIIPAATGPQPIRYQPRDDFTPQLPHQLFSNPGANLPEGIQEESMLSTIHEIPRKQPVNSMQMVLETMRQLRDKYGPELEQRELQVLDSFLSDPDIVPAYKICKRMNKARESLKRSEDPSPKITNSAHLLGDCVKDLRSKHATDPDRSELIYLLSSLVLTHALVSHDRIATMDYFTPFPSPLYPHSGMTPLHSPGKLSPNISRSVSSSGLLEGTNSREFRIDNTVRTGSVASALQLMEIHTRENSASSFVHQRPVSRTAYGGKGINARIVLVRKSHKQMGCTVNRVDESIIVTGTLRHSDAEKCGRLHPGDEILEINGKTVSGRSAEQVMNFILSQTGPMIVFLIVPCTAVDKKEIFIRPFYDFSAQQIPDCPFVDVLLPFNKGDILRLLSCYDDEWWEAKQLSDPPEAVPGLIPAKKKEDPSDLLPGEVPEPGGKSKRKIRWPKSKKKKKSDLYTDPNSLQLTQDLVTYEEVGLLAPTVNYKPRPILLVGASGVGHKRVIQSVLDKYPHIFCLPIYHTSRPPKSHEKKGIEFHFTTRRVFEQSASQKIILDPWESGSHMYGVAATSIQVVVESGKSCIQALTPDSMRFIRNQTNLMPYVIFLAAPQPGVLREQLKQTQKGAFRRVRSDQGSRDKQITSIIASSLEIAQEYGGYFDEVITNLVSEATADHIYQISVRLKKEPQWVPISWIHTINPPH